MDVSTALEKALEDLGDAQPNSPLLGLKISTPDGDTTIKNVRECSKYPGYIINDKYLLGFYKAAELLGGSL